MTANSASFEGRRNPMFNIILVRPSINLISMSDLLIRKILHKQIFMKVRTFFLPYQALT